jgi:hypothetical protein
MTKEVIVEIGEDGNAEVRAEGYKGKGCIKDTAWVEEALGMGDGKRVKKKEYYLTEKVKQKQKVG